MSSETLLRKYDLEIDQLDYEFIRNCKEAKLLEKILMVLRSGEEGVFPDLTAFCEKSLKEIDSSSWLLNLPKPIQRISDLSEKERSELGAFVGKWNYQGNKDLPEITQSSLPPVRGASLKIETTTKMKISDVKPIMKKCKPRSYAEWEKFNVERELEKMEDGEEKENVPKHSSKDLQRHSKLSRTIPNPGNSEKEKIYIAELEKNKGNESFKARDYEEAILYYTRSLSVLKNASTLNNRAQAYIKIKNYFEAIQDCNAVLMMEPENVKALYRRGVAYKEEQVFDFAKRDFKMILDIDSENKLAKDQLREIKNLKLSKTNRKKVLIEEVNSSEIHNERVLENSENTKSTRLTIEEVQSNSRELKLSELDFSSEEEDSTTQLPPRLKQMLKIKQNSKQSTTAKATKVLEIKESSTKKFNLIEEYHDIEPKIKSPCNNEQKLKDDYVNVKIECDTDELNNYGSKVFKNGSSPNVEEDCKNAEQNNYINKDLDIKSPNTNFCKKSEEVKNNNLKEIVQNDLKSDDDPGKSSCEMNMDNTGCIEEVTDNQVTPYEFLCNWLSSNASEDSNLGARFLLKIRPEELPKFVSDKLDGSLLIGLLKAIFKIFELGKTEEANNFLCSLTKVHRIKIASMFLSQEEAAGIRDLFSKLENNKEIQTCLNKIVRI